MDDSTKNSEERDIESRYKYDVWIFHALSTLDEENALLTGRDIDGIAKYITDRHEVQENFREELIKELGRLVSEGHIEMVEGRYKVFHGMIESEEPEGASVPTNAMSSLEAVEPEGASDPTNTMSSPMAVEPEGAAEPTEETTSSDKSTSNEEGTTSPEENPPPQDQPSTSSSGRPESVKRLELKMLINLVVAAEDSEFIAKEANDAYHTSLEMIRENMANLSVANGILRNCDVLTESSSLFSGLTSFSFIITRLLLRPLQALTATRFTSGEGVISWSASMWSVR